MKKKNLEVFQQAVKFSQSGKCKDWKDVQEALVKKDLKRAPDLLDDAKIRAILDAQCRMARK